jgi:hypothetical protein
MTDLFAGSGYASAYYVYLWAEVLDAGTHLVLSSGGLLIHTPELIDLCPADDSARCVCEL